MATSIKKSKISVGYDLLKAKFFKKRTPLAVGWSLTNRCNWRCTYCSIDNRASEELSAQQICAIVDQLSEMSTYIINFTGGEPLLREDMEHIIDYTKRKGIRVCICTNGSLVSRRIKEIKNIDSLTISYDGPEEIHNKQRQKGTYRYVEDAVAAAKKYNIPVRLHTVLTANNIECIDSILTFARMFDVPVNFAVVEITAGNREKDIEILLPAKEKYKIAMRDLISKKRKGSEHIGNSLQGLMHLVQWPEYKRIDCCAGKIYCRIEPNGDLYPCTNLLFRNSPPNCVREGFKTAFRRLCVENCKSCWCDTRIELNNIYSLNLSSILNLKKTYKL
ncbi:MAG: radical SAM protein [Candidatus Omnitrophica bacterium]|nr:radical SAM protein [Candidatus Omnitrophota bacterium]